MGKSLLYRLFGVGKIPQQMLAQLQQEGILLSDEGVKGSVTYRDFRAPGRYSSWRRVGLIASIIVTNVRLVALSSSNPLINVPFSDERIHGLKCSVEEGEKLLIAFDASLFHDDWSGTIEYRFRTPQAQRFLELLREGGV